MLHKDSIANTFLVSIVLCVVCSIAVSGAAVVLKPRQERNKVLDRQRNIIAAARIGEKSADSLSSSEVESLFGSKVERKLVDLNTGDYVDSPDPNFEPKKAAKEQASSSPVEGKFTTGMPRRENDTWVYLVKGDNGQIESVVLPVYGRGLWSTMYGYVAVDKDIQTINGLTFYEHGETPGLGGEIENPSWKSKWVGKKIWSEGADKSDENLRVGVAKAAPTSENADYMVDGLSGATITSRGVDSMLKYWFSDNGFGKYLKKLASEQGASNG